MVLKQNSIKYLLLLLFAFPWPLVLVQYCPAQIASENPVIIDKNELKKRADKLDFSEKPTLERKPKNRQSSTFTKSNNSGLGSINGNIIIVFICVLLAIAVVIVIFNSRINAKTNAAEDIVIEGKNAETTKNLQALNIDNLLKQALANADYKMAIRLLYLGQLKMFMEKGLLKPAPHKTNGEYVLELSNTPYREQFNKNTHLFESVWYGDVSINRVIYDAAESNFLYLSNLIKK